jgi:pSer/pThr/pTyr-binding forkhead associated (FHA) protein
MNRTKPITIRQLAPERKAFATLAEPQILIGKKPECVIRFSGVPGISGIHAILTWTEGGWFVSDPGAAEPVRLDDRTIPFNVQVPLPSGAKLTLAKVVLTVSY